MREIVRKHGKTSEFIRRLAVALTNHLPQKDYVGQVKAYHAFVRDKIRYIRDINDVETLHFPEIVVERRSGDCDDKSILLASLLESTGHPTRFVAVGFTPGEFAHVYVETLIGNRWVPLETTEPVEIGWSPKNVQSRKIVHV